jgi:hypothetical protein
MPKKPTTSREAVKDVDAAIRNARSVLHTVLVRSEGKEDTRIRARKSNASKTLPKACAGCRK